MEVAPTGSADMPAPGGPARPRVATVHGPPLTVGDCALVDGHAHAWLGARPGSAPACALDPADEGTQSAGRAALARAVNDWARDRGGGTEPPATVHDKADGAARAGAVYPARHRPWRVGSIDCQPPFAGRDARRLAAISRDSGVALACVTGFHLARYYPAGVRPWSSAAAAADLFEREVTTGLTEAPSR